MWRNRSRRWRGLPERDISWFSPGKRTKRTAELHHVEAVSDVARAEHRVLAVHGALRARGLEPVGVPHGPARQEAPVAPAEDPEPFRVDERVTPECLVEGRHDVRVIAPAPVAD